MEAAITHEPRTVGTRSWPAGTPHHDSGRTMTTGHFAW